MTRAHIAGVLVVGGGPAGLEVARVAAQRGHRVTLRERAVDTGGAVEVAARARGRAPLAGVVRWLAAECRRLGEAVETGVEVDGATLAAWPGPVVLATGSHGRPSEVPGGPGADRWTSADVLAADPERWPTGPVVVSDPVGGPEEVAVAETLVAAGRAVTLVSPDFVVATQLALAGDLAPANLRLHQAGVTLVRRALLRGVDADSVTVEDRFSAQCRQLAAPWFVDAGWRLADDALGAVHGDGTLQAGDCVAPRTIYEAILEGRRAALALGAAGRTAPARSPVGADRGPERRRDHRTGGCGAPLLTWSHGGLELR